MRTKNDNPADKIVGENIARIRQSTGREGKRVEQQVIAKEIGVSTRQLRRYETGLDRLSASRLWQLKQSLNCNIEDFFEGLEGFESTGQQIANLTFQVQGLEQELNAAKTEIQQLRGDT